MCYHHSVHSRSLSVQALWRHMPSYIPDVWGWTSCVYILVCLFNECGVHKDVQHFLVHQGLLRQQLFQGPSNLSGSLYKQAMAIPMEIMPQSVLKICEAGRLSLLSLNGSLCSVWTVEAYIELSLSQSPNRVLLVLKYLIFVNTLWFHLNLMID